MTKNIKRHPLHRKHSQNSLIHHILKCKVNICTHTQGFPGSSVVKESACQCWKHKTHGFDPWVVMIPWRRKWQPTPVFLPGKSHEQRTLSGYSPRDHKESDTTEPLSTSTHTHIYMCWGGGHVVYVCI